MNDVERSLNKADKVFKGPLGWLTKLFMGKNFVAQTQSSLNMARKYAVSDPQKRQELMATGSTGKATVLSIQDTGTLINYNPVVKLQLKVTPDYGNEFETTIETPVSKVAIPRQGDMLNVRYNPMNSSEVVLA